VGLIGVIITLSASLYSSNETIGISFGLWFIGMLFIAYWFFKGSHSHLEIFAMILFGIGQIMFWGIVHYIKSELLMGSGVYFAIIFVLIFWILSIIIFLNRSEQRTKLERKSFSKYVKDEILERQQNKCAMCNDKLFYCHFDHIDGNRSNNRISNCQALCANCDDLKTRRDQRKKQNN
jgi:hypothetical protein